MKHILTFAFSMAVVCSLALPASADYGKGNSGKSSTTSPKTKHPKEKNPQPTTPTNPTTPTTPPVILLNKKTTLSSQDLVKKNTAGKVTNDVLKNKDVSKEKAPQNTGPFPPHIFDKKKDKQHDKDCHDGHCHAGKEGDCHDGQPGNGGHNPPPIDPGNGSGHPTTQNPPPRDGYVWVPANGNVPGHWERERAPTTTPTKPGFVWVPATATVPGHWERAKAK